MRQPARTGGGNSHRLDQEPLRDLLPSTQSLVLERLNPPDPPVLLGTLQFDFWVLGFTTDGSRRSDFVASIENIVARPEPGVDAQPWGIDMEFSTFVTGAGTIVHPSIEERDDVIGAWNTTPQWTVTYTSPDDGLTIPFKAVPATTNVLLSVHSPGATAAQNPVTPASNFRFDSAGAVAGKAQGTVFVDARVTFTISLSDAAVRESARHFDDALHHPDRTFPSIPAKNVPGENRPLRRLIDSVRQDANRKAANDVCDAVWGTHDGSVVNCDEFPFASTYEGAAFGDQNVSARLIDAKDNQLAGTRLGSMYTANRMLDKDEFFVQVVP
jgi:hypothetical protein